MKKWHANENYIGVAWLICGKVHHLVCLAYKNEQMNVINVKICCEIRQVTLNHQMCVSFGENLEALDKAK